MVVSSPNYTEESRWFMGELLLLESGTENGGMYANKPGYHNTRKANAKTNYSVVDTVDKQGPDDKSAAYDWTFKDAQAGRYDRIMHYTNLLLSSAKDLDDPRLNGWREFYGQADTDLQVEGWDTRYGVPATSDPSHLWHLHFSETRGLVNDHANKVAMLSVLKGETVAQWRHDGVDVAIYIIVTDDPNHPGGVFTTSFAGRKWQDDVGEVARNGGPVWGAGVKSYTAAVADSLFGRDIDVPFTSTTPGPITLVPHTHTFTVNGSTGEAVLTLTEKK